MDTVQEMLDAIAAGTPVTHVHDQTGVPYGTLKLLWRADPRYRQRGGRGFRSERASRAAQLVEAGMSFRDAARAVGVSSRAVLAACRVRGIKSVRSKETGND